MNSYQERLNEVAVQLNCYEPAGESLEITERDLLGHTLITGGSGAGKTTRAIYPMLQQLIALRADDNATRHGMVIYDAKGDGEVCRFLEKCCRDCGREADLIVVSTDENSASLDMLHGLRENMEAVDSLAGVLASCIPRGSTDRYWEMTTEAMIRQALRMFILGEDSISYTSMVSFIIAYLLKADMRDSGIRMRLSKINSVSIDSTPTPINRDLLDHISASHWMWVTLADRTKSIIQSMVAPLIDSLNSPVAKRLFACGQSCQISETIESGGIVLVSLDAIRHATEARLAGCLMKGQFYDAILARTAHSKIMRPSGLFLDDWLLSATGGVGDRYSDVSALSILRSRGGYVVSACQSLASLDLVIGERARRAAYANFANLIFFRGRDAELDTFAAAYFGQTSQRLTDYTSRHISPDGDYSRHMRIEREIRVPSVPHGSLAKLPMGECYAIVGDRIFDKPLCLVPTFAPET